MKKPGTKLAKCLSCDIEQYRTEMEICISILEKIEKKKFKHYKELKLEQYTYDSFVDSDFDWACDKCLVSKRAILSSPGLLETSGTPHLAYFDSKLTCNTCKYEFLFKKEEKKKWYETYKLPIHAQPNDCNECRKKSRKLNSENKALSEILKKSEKEISNKELEKVVEIYAIWDNMEKVKYYQSVLKKRTN